MVGMQVYRANFIKLKHSHVPQCSHFTPRYFLCKSIMYVYQETQRIIFILTLFVIDKRKRQEIINDLDKWIYKTIKYFQVIKVNYSII
jgi:hypothetical protein